MARIEVVGDAVTLRVDLPAAIVVDSVRLGPGLVPGAYRLGRLRLGDRAVADLARRCYDPTAGIADGDWIAFEARSDEPGPEFDVHDLFASGAGTAACSPLRVDIARAPSASGYDPTALRQAVAAAVVSAQLPIGAAVAALEPRFDEIGLGLEAMIRAGAAEGASRDARLESALRDVVARLDSTGAGYAVLAHRIDEQGQLLQRLMTEHAAAWVRLEVTQRSTWWMRLRRRLGGGQ